MKIVQKINTKDIINFNTYLLEKNLSYKFSIIILGLLSLLLGVASIVYELLKIQTVYPSTIVISSLLIIIGVFAFTGLKPLLRVLLKKKIMKKNEQIEDIRVTLNETGLLWEFDQIPSKKKFYHTLGIQLLKHVKKVIIFIFMLMHMLYCLLKKSVAKM